MIFPNLYIKVKCQFLMAFHIDFPIFSILPQRLFLLFKGCIIGHSFRNAKLGCIIAVPNFCVTLFYRVLYFLKVSLCKFISCVSKTHTCMKSLQSGHAACQVVISAM